MEKTFYRNFTLELDRSSPDILTATLSSETPVKRDFGLEILDHGEGSIDLSRAKSGLPILYQHERDEIIGRAEGLKVVNRTLKGNLRRAKTSRAGEIWGLVDERILLDVSVSYELDFDAVERSGDTFRFKRWTPLEVSLVSIGADPAAGIGRSKTNEGDHINMKCEKCGAELVNGKCLACESKNESKERTRSSEILAMGTRAGLLDQAVQFVRDGRSIEEFAQMIIEEAKKKLDPKIDPSGNFRERYIESVEPPDFTRGPFIGKKFAEVFGYRGNMGKWKNAHEFFNTLARGIGDARLERMDRGHSEGTGAAGGFLLPSAVAEVWFDNSMEASFVLPRAQMFPCPGDHIRVPAMNLSHSGGNIYGGVYASWKGEMTDADEQAARIRQVLFSMYKLFLYTSSSNELIQDSSIDRIIRTVFLTASDYFLDTAWVRGTGAAEPLGVLTTGNKALISVSRNTAAHVKFADVVSMIARLNPGSFKTSVWLAHPSTLGDLHSLIIFDGVNPISHVPILSENGELRLMGRPLIPTEKCEMLGTAGDFALVDFSQYGIGWHPSPGLEVSQHELFKKDSSSFRLCQRVDGAPMWNEACTLRDGSYTVSPYVALA